MLHDLAQVTWELPAMEGISSGHDYLSGYEGDISWLNREVLISSGFIEAYSAAADLMMQQHCQIARATVLPSVLLSTRFNSRL